MRQNIRVLIILMAAFALLSLQENKANNLEIIQKTTDYFKDPKFIEDFVASYGVLPGVEPLEISLITGSPSTYFNSI